MELDDFKRKKESPESGNSKSNDSNSKNADSVLELFRIEQANARKLALAWAVVLVGLSVCYFGLTGRGDGLFMAGMMILGTGMIMGALYMWMSSRPVPDSIYTLPMTSFLNFAQKKLRYLPAEDMVKIVPILIAFGVGGGMVFISRLSLYTSRTSLLLIIWVVFFVSLCIFGYFAGKGTWRRKVGDLADMIEQAKKDLII
jgi:hypothetical protein